MSNETNPADKDDGSTAVQYVNDQLQQSTKSLGRTRVVCVILVLIVAAYMAFVTRGLLQYLEPSSAATIARGVIAEQVTNGGEGVANQLYEEVPKWIAQLPDYALKQIPVVRTEVEDKIERAVTDTVKNSAAEIDKHIDQFLDTNKDDIKTVLDGTQDIETVRHLGPSLEKEMLVYLNEPHDDGESLQKKLDHALADLEKVSARVEHLANATNLTPEEKKARRAIAVLLKKTDWGTISQPASVTEGK